MWKNYEEDSSGGYKRCTGKTGGKDVYRGWF